MPSIEWNLQDMCSPMSHPMPSWSAPYYLDQLLAWSLCNLLCPPRTRKQKNFGIIQDIFLLGTMLSASQKSRCETCSVVSGQYVNTFARNDWVLNYLFRVSIGHSGHSCWAETDWGCARSWKCGCDRWDCGAYELLHVHAFNPWSAWISSFIWLLWRTWSKWS